MKLIEGLKNLIPLSIFYALRARKSFFNQKKIEKSKKARIFYLDAPDYGNLGDQAIALSIEQFAQDYFHEYEFIELTYNQYPFYEKDILRNIRQEDIIFLTGGGNMGNKYRAFEAVRRRIIRKFRKNTVVVFPQTIDYTNNCFGKLSAWKSKRIYSKNNKLIICAREAFSFSKMETLYNKNTVLLTPDIVLSLKYNIQGCERTDYSLCLRNDCERALSKEEHNKIIQTLDKYALQKSILTTAGTDKGKIDIESREEEIFNKLEEFSKNKIIITDRLHGMIFASITSTPCIVFSNSNKKIEGVYNWLENKSYVKFLTSVDDLEPTIDELLKNNNTAFIRNDVCWLSEKIRESVNGAN